MIKRSSLIICMIFSLTLQPFLMQGSSQGTGEPSKKLVLSPYGFLKGDMIYSSAEVNSFGIVSLGAPQLATGTDRSALGFTAQHTRLGLRGSVGETVKAGGLVEIDFFSNAFDANGKPRIRLAYASIGKGGFEARFGQQWDLFSPNNANTNNTNGNMWFAGNRGFRRTQIQLSYKLPGDMISPMLQVSAGETCREEAGLGKDNLSGIPMLQARLSGTISSKYIVGVSVVSGTYLEKRGTIVIGGILDEDFTFNTSGVCLDFNLPLHDYLSITGEVNAGTNLNNANLFSVSGNFSWLISAGEVVKYARKSMGVWVNATSKLSDHVHLIVGYGLDKNTSVLIPLNDTEKNRVAYGNITIPINHGFALSLELMNINTVKVAGLDMDNNITSRHSWKANVISLAGKITF